MEIISINCIPAENNPRLSKSILPCMKILLIPPYAYSEKKIKVIFKFLKRDLSKICNKLNLKDFIKSLFK